MLNLLLNLFGGRSTRRCAQCHAVGNKADMVRTGFGWFCNGNHQRKWTDRTW